MESIVIVVTGCLALCAAGLVPGVAPAAALVLLAAVLTRPFPAGRCSRLMFWCALALLAWVGVTLLPVGPLAGSWRTAQWDALNAFRTAAADVPELASAGEMLRRPAVPRLTLHAPGTGRWLFLAVGALASYWFTASLRLRQRLHLMIALVGLGTVVGVAGFLSWYVIPQGETVCWWYPVSTIGGGNPIGPFVNRNHFAAFCAMLTPLAMTLAVAPSRRPVLLIRNRQGQLEELCLTEHRATRIAMAVCLLLLAAAVLSSRSRGGTAAMLVGLSFAALLWLKSGRTAGTFAGVVGMGAFLLVAFWPDSGLQDRLHGMRDASDAIGARWLVWQDALRMWRQFPVAGVGMNAFRMAFGQITDWAVGQEATHAESDVLQFVAEGGTIGVLLGALVLASLLFAILKTRFAGARHLLAFGMWEERFDDETPEHRDQVSRGRIPYAYAVASCAGMVAVGFASLVDVPLRVPLAAWTAAAVLGLSAPLPMSRRNGPRAPFLWMWPERVILVLLFAVLLGAAAIRPGWRALYRDRQDWLSTATTPEIIRLLDDCPTYWQAWYEVGDRLLADLGREDAQDNPAVEAGWLALEQAVRCNPRNPQLLANVASRLWRVGRWDEARAVRDRQVALEGEPVALMRGWLTREWDAGFRDEARHLAQQWLEAMTSKKAKVDLYVWLGRNEMQQGRVTEARRWLTQALDIDPQHQHALRTLAQCEQQLGYLEREHDVLRQYLELHADDARTWWRLVQVERQLGHRRHLEQALGEASRLNPRYRRQADQIWKDFILDQNE